MMRASLGLVLALIGGCAFEPGQYSDDNGGEGGNGGGSGTGSGSSTPMADSDGDGMLDAVDNCVDIANADQRDHDDDHRGDACDVCPHLMDTGADGDHDGVGDACDPRPTEAGDRIAFFEGFYGAISWNNAIGANTWMLDVGTVHQPDVVDQHQLVRDDNPDLKSVFIDMRVRVNAVSSDDDSRRSMGIVAGYRDDEHYLFCGLAAEDGNAAVNAGQVDTNFWGDSEFNYDESTFSAPMTGGWLSVQARTIPVDDDTTRIECSASRAGLPTPTNAVYDASTSIHGDVGIRTNGADASFDYVFVVEMPTPTP